jgi:hypothetical protein
MTACSDAPIGTFGARSPAIPLEYAEAKRPLPQVLRTTFFYASGADLDATGAMGAFGFPFSPDKNEAG